MSNRSSISVQVHDMQYIQETYMRRPMKREWEDEPRDPLARYCVARMVTPPAYVSVQFMGPSGVLWRTTVTLEDDDGDVVGVGDHKPQKKESERLAALCALYQLDAKGLLDAIKEKEDARVPAAELSDGTVVGYDRTREFMEFYCQRSGFGSPEVEYAQEREGEGGWQAIMTVGGKRIGLGTGPSDNDALVSCYIDVTEYLESCDPDLWQAFADKSEKPR